VETDEGNADDIRRSDDAKMSATNGAVSIIGSFISQLRTNALIFEGRVAGAAEFYKGLRDYSTSMPMPAAYVLPLGQDAEPNKTYGGLIQLVHKGIGIAVELDAQRDRRGQDPTMSFEIIETQIMASCLNLYIGECRMTQGVYFTGARYLDLDRARLWYQWEFGLDWQLDDRDGVIACGYGDTSPPLDTIEIDYTLAGKTIAPVVQQLDMQSGASLDAITIPRRGK
jgi:hypothetical protein